MMQPQAMLLAQYWRAEWEWRGAGGTVRSRPRRLPARRATRRVRRLRWLLSA